MGELKLKKLVIFKKKCTNIIDFNSLDKFGYYKSNTKLNSPEVLFKRIEPK